MTHDGFGYLFLRQSHWTDLGLGQLGKHCGNCIVDVVTELYILLFIQHLCLFSIVDAVALVMTQV